MDPTVAQGAGWREEPLLLASCVMVGKINLLPPCAMVVHASSPQWIGGVFSNIDKCLRGERRFPFWSLYVEGLAPLCRGDRALYKGKSGVHLATCLPGLRGRSEHPAFGVPSRSLSTEQKQRLCPSWHRSHRVNSVSPHREPGGRTGQNQDLPLDLSSPG